MLRPIFGISLFFAFAVSLLGADAAGKTLCPSKLYNESFPCRLEIIGFVDVTVPDDQPQLARRVPELKTVIRESLKTDMPFLRHEERTPEAAKQKFKSIDEMRRRGGLDCSVLVFEEDKGTFASFVVDCVLWSYADYQLTKDVINHFHARRIGHAPKDQLVGDIEAAIRRNVLKISDTFKITRMIYSKRED